MSIKDGYEKGFAIGVDFFAEKIAEEYNLDKVAVMSRIRDAVGMKRKEEPKPLVSGSDLALAGGSLGAGGLGIAAERYAPKIDAVGAEIAALESQAARQRPRWDNLVNNFGVTGADGAKTLDAAGLDDAAKAQLTKNIRKIKKNFANQGLFQAYLAKNPGHTYDDAVKALLKEKAGLAATEAGIANNQKSLAGRLGRTGLNSAAMSTIGKGLQVAGGVGGLGLLGKKVYDLATS